uniref:Uncharacterized protein YuzE n=1 Tax=Candidatus Kentrum sp. LFY TaxID=2126342 RepID=A0A450WHS1_9GAMM|nr:MAG: Uncharacterized protein YuzE [Candidatus Kentron sp. LFY]
MFGIQRIEYLEDTDTAHMEFSANPVSETREINENLYIDLEDIVNPVGMTVEHASVQANISELTFQRIAAEG